MMPSATICWEGWDQVLPSRRSVPPLDRELAPRPRRSRSERLKRAERVRRGGSYLELREVSA